MFDVNLVFDALLAWGIPIVLFVGGCLWLASAYTVVPPHEAHVVIQRKKGRNLYCAREGYASSYFALPFIQKRVRLPLRNKQLVISDIPLRDKNLAKFLCDVVCWINIDDPIQAAERIGEQERIEDFSGVEDDITNLVRAVTRNSSMTMDLVTLMSDRLEFSKRVADEIETSIKDWGVQLVDLECVHFQDQPPYTVIHDLEQRQAEKINSTTRQEVAEQKKLANVAESNAERETKLTQAKDMEEYRKAEIERDETISTREEEKNVAVAEMTQKANKASVEAKRTLDVGNAEVEQESLIVKAKGEAEETRQQGQAESDVIELRGNSEASVTKAKMLAEAEGIDKKAEAQKKYNQAGAMAIEIVTSMIDASKEIEISKYENLGGALKAAKINVLSTGEKDLLGIPIGAEAGIAFGGMVTAMKESGLDIGSFLRDVGEVLKTIKNDDVSDEKKKRW